MPPVMDKEDFVNSVHSSLSLDMLKRFTLAPNSSDERLTGVLLATMVWAGREGQQRNLLMHYRHAANYIKMSYQDHLLTQQQESILKSHGIEELLYLVWDTVEWVRNSPDFVMEHKAVLAYLRERFNENNPL